MSIEPLFNKFDVPEKTINQLYESSGKDGVYKGIILAYCTEEGEPVIFSRTDTKITEMGLKKALEEFLTDYQEIKEIDAEE
tara:strand:+ start:82 stop:324 length:243 start_codon:yes stop_codon:yes gene_type:complete